MGGGIKKLQDIEVLLKSGADKVSINTSAILEPNLIQEASKEFGSQCIVVAIDAKKDGDAWSVYTHGGKNKTELDAIEWAKKVEGLGAGEILMTSMDKDGTKSGYDNDLNKKLSSHLRIPLIASGGAGQLSHLVDAIKIGKADAVLAASIFHYEEISIARVKEELMKNNLDESLKSENKDGNTPLHLAALAGDTNLMYKLIMLGSDISQTNVHGDSALHSAIRSSKLIPLIRVNNI